LSGLAGFGPCLRISLNRPDEQVFLLVVGRHRRDFRLDEQPSDKLRWCRERERAQVVEDRVFARLLTGLFFDPPHLSHHLPLRLSRLRRARGAEPEGTDQRDTLAGVGRLEQAAKLGISVSAVH